MCLVTHEIKNKPFEVQGINFQPIEVLHHKLPVFGYRIQDFTYITDAKSISPEELDKIKGSRVLVLNTLQIKEHLSHLTLEEALEIVHMIKPEKAFFTHISHKLGTHYAIEQLLPDDVYLAYDGLKITLD